MTKREYISFGTMGEMSAVYSEPCNNCTRFDAGIICDLGHRLKDIGINEGHMPEVTVRRAGGCPDHAIMEGTWWNEEPIQRHQPGYGGSSTSILF